MVQHNMQAKKTSAKLYINPHKRQQPPVLQHDKSSYTLSFQPRTQIYIYLYMYIYTYIRNARKVLKYGAGEGWRRSVGPIM